MIKSSKVASKLLHGAEEKTRKTLLNPKEKSQTRKVNGKAITFNNLDKIYFPKGKVTKRDVINYYYLVAPFMMPYMKDRPQTLIRYPNGINGKSFYQKDVTGKVRIGLKSFHTAASVAGSETL